jgi:hypothetical protein
MPLDNNTAAICREFLDYCRSKTVSPPAGVNVERAGQYRRLSQNIVFHALRRAYPITAGVIGEEKWHELIAAFFANCDLPSPQLWKMPRILLDFVERTNCSEQLKIPYLKDLLAFEWAEIEVFMMSDAKYPALFRAGD